MMPTDSETLLMAGGMGVAALVWLVRLEGRVGTNETIIKVLQKDVTYIRERIDLALNGYRHRRDTDAADD